MAAKKAVNGVCCNCGWSGEEETTCSAGTTVPTANIGGMARMEIVKATKKIFDLLSR